MVAGTPQYMSPEQVRGEECDWHSDLFSLGCVMYAMCVGCSPFAAETPYGAMHRIVHDKPSPIRDANPAVPSWLEQFILRLLEKNPSRRFESTRQVIELLALELQDLQRSSTTAKRHTWRRQYVHRDSRALRRRSIAAPLGVAVISAALFLAPWIGSSPQTDSSDLQRGAESTQSQAPSEFRWNDDASLAPIRAGIDAVQSDLRRDSKAEDQWRSSMNEIEAEMRAILDSPF
jgi:serine/threonine protein kinase